MSRYIDVDEFLANESEAYMNAQIKLAKENADKTIDHDRYINLLVHKKIQMLIADTPTIDLDTNAWCEDCKEYDKENHKCPRFNRVIRTALEDAGMVRVVQCKECKHWNEEDHWCNIRDSYGWDYKPDDFCSYGERKEGEQ